MKRLIVLLAVIAVFASGALVQPSGASFTSGGGSTLNVTADRIQNWIHLYSQSTDPDSLTGYWTQAPGSNSAAIGLDSTLAVNLGTVGNGPTHCRQVFTLKTPSAFPTGASATVTASLLADPVTGSQPLTNVGFSDVGSSGYTNPTTLGVGNKIQLNLKVSAHPAGVTYRPTILIRITYGGLTAAYYQYSVPVTVWGSNRDGCARVVVPISVDCFPLDRECFEAVLIEHLLVLERRTAAKRRMSAMRVVESLEVLEDSQPGLVWRLEALLPQKFGLDAGHETLGGIVVRGITRGAHGGKDARVPQCAAEGQ